MKSAQWPEIHMSRPHQAGQARGYSHHPHAGRDVQGMDGDAVEEAGDGASLKARDTGRVSRGGDGTAGRSTGGMACETTEALPTPGPKPPALRLPRRVRPTELLVTGRLPAQAPLRGCGGLAPARRGSEGTSPSLSWGLEGPAFWTRVVPTPTSQGGSDERENCLSRAQSHSQGWAR